MKRRMFFLMLGFIAAVAVGNVATVYADSAREIDASVDTALERFDREVVSAKEVLAKAKGVLVIPKVVKAGIVIGGEYGVGALRVRGKSVEYYDIRGGSLGLQFGAQMKDVYLLFMEDQVLKDFRESDGWQGGVDGSFAVMSTGGDASADTTKTNQSIIAYVLGQKGFMLNLNLEGAKFNKIIPE